MYLGNRRCCINNIIEGITGPQGTQGSYGLIGEIGLTGSTGMQGSQGDAGICYRGLKGNIGYRGPQGGLTGNEGPPGPNGEPGPYNASQNLHFSFQISNMNSYSNSFIELTSLATTPVSNTINLDNGKYAIQYQISENWSDTNSIIYIEFYNSTNYYPFVFNVNNQSYLVLSTNGNKLFGTGNDIITLPDNTPYTIKIYQSNTSGSLISIGGKTIYFSITFTKLL